MTRAARRYRRDGRTIRIAFAPAGLDFNDVLRGAGDTFFHGFRQQRAFGEFAAHADGARPRTEVLWINPQCAEALDREKRSLHTLMAGAE
jgi:hypothetical protein